MRIINSERGQAIVLIAFAIIGLVGITALAIDGGNAFADRRKAQSAADNAAMAGALASVSNQNVNTAAANLIGLNHPINDGWVINNPPGPGCNGITPTITLLNSDDNIHYYFQVVLHTHVDTFFGSVIGIPQMFNCVQAIARAKPPVSGTPGGPWGIQAWDPHGCPAFDDGGTADTVVQGGGIFVNSDCTSNAMAFKQHGSSITTVTAGGICVNGDANYDPNNVIADVTQNCGKPLVYPPPASNLPPLPTCTVDSSIGGNNITPGNIDGHAFGGTINLEPGIYCVHGNINFNSGDVITGYGVLLYIIDGKLTVNGGATVNLCAMHTTCPKAPSPNDPLVSPPEYESWWGFLIYLPMTNTNKVTLNGNSDSGYTGTIMAPASLIEVNGTNSNYGYHSAIIGFDVTLTGTAATNVFYNGADNGEVTVPPALDMVK